MMTWMNSVSFSLKAHAKRPVENNAQRECFAALPSAALAATYRPAFARVRLGLACLLVTAVGFNVARAQDQRRHKIPVVNKMTQGVNRQAFSGKVESLDLGLHVLEVNATEGKSMEIFPIKKGIQVSTAGGEKLNLEELRRGNDVIIYYEQKGDRRTVKQIVVLASSPGESNKKHPPRS